LRLAPLDRFGWVAILAKDMNFIAHLVLSPKETDFISGNLAADFLRGSNRKLISESVQNGISMHQFVDKYTHFRLLSGVFVDVFYDHFLAKDFEHIANISLEEFCEYIYETLEKNIVGLPPRLQQFIPIMIRENILFSYRKLEGVQTSLTRINRRIKKKFSVRLAMVNLKNIYESLENDFRIFFPRLIDATESYRKDYGTFLLPTLIN
jgi:acyl carrier protein phosphodiesterase